MPRSRRADIPCDELRTRYLAGQNTPALARFYHCSPTTIANRLRDCEVPLRNGRFQPRIVPEALLRQLYLEERFSLRDIAAYLGVSVSTIGNKRRFYGIATRLRMP